MDTPIMSNPSHVKLVRKGAAAINSWQLIHKGDRLQLTGINIDNAKLSGINLEKAFLDYAYLSDTDFSKANFSRAELFESTISFSDFSAANLSRTNLMYATLRGVILSNADLSHAKLNGTLIAYPGIPTGKANLKNARMGYSSLIYCDMNVFENIETVRHNAPSFVDIETLVTSYVNSDESFDAKLRHFFVDAGVSSALLDCLPDIVAGMAYCNCFVCYGEPDKKFAEKLVKDLKAEGVHCWIYSMNATPGKKVWKEINEIRRKADKMIVLCSAKALVREGVKKEIEEQLDEEPDNLIPISLDNLWKEEGFLIKRGQRDLKQELLDRTYADFSNPSKYKQSLRRLLRALKKRKT